MLLAYYLPPTGQFSILVIYVATLIPPALVPDLKHGVVLPLDVSVTNFSRKNKQYL